MGKPAFFIRLYGCNVGCTFCDSAGTWHKDFVPDHIEKMDEIQLLAEVREAGMERVVITGGEPAMFNLEPLVSALWNGGRAVHLETSGAYPIKGGTFVHWVTLSPKKWKMPLGVNVGRADEFKFIIEAPEDIEFYWNVIKQDASCGTQYPDVWLHPEWSQRENPVVLNAISEAVKKGDRPFRAGWQLHKLYRIDALDKRSKPLVPLGGDPSKGF